MQICEFGSAAWSLQFEYCLSSDAVVGEALLLGGLSVVFGREEDRVRDLEDPEENAGVNRLLLLLLLLLPPRELLRLLL